MERFATCAHSDSGSKRRARGRGFGFKFGQRLATSTERARSRSPCGVRARDKCTKRSGGSRWTVGHRVIGLAERGTDLQ